MNQTPAANPWISHLEPRRARAVAKLRGRRAAERHPKWSLPAYADPGPETTQDVFCGIASFRRHMSNEGWQLQDGLRQAGYHLYGRHFPAPYNQVNVVAIAEQVKPRVLIVQDKREWDPSRAGCFDKTEGFCNVAAVRERDDIFRATVWKDAWFSRSYHRGGHYDLNPHVYITYYHDDLISYFSPWIHPQQLIRTYHSVDPAQVPAYSAKDRHGALVSGALNPAVYPLRYSMAVAAKAGGLTDTAVLRHPGYHAKRTSTAAFLQRMSHYRVAICTSSIFGCALRKIIEAAACGCVPITDLPAADALPVIDGALVRVSSDASTSDLNECIREQGAHYDANLREAWATKARQHYDYRSIYASLASRIAERQRSWTA
jgi:hypothetical protein